MNSLEKIQNIFNSEMKERFNISIGDTVNFSKMELSPVNSSIQDDTKLCYFRHDEDVLIRKVIYLAPQTIASYDNDVCYIIYSPFKKNGEPSNVLKYGPRFNLLK